MYREFKFNIDGAKLDQLFSSQLAMQHCHDAMMTPDTATFPSYAAVDTVVPRLHGLKRTMADREADDETPKTAFSCSVVKKVKRSHTVPDVGATVRLLARSMGRCADLSPDLYPPVVRSLFGDRVAVFTLLETAALGWQCFSLDNGMALQDTLDWWLRRYRRPRLPLARDALRLLKKHREPHSVMWEGRDLRIWSWPAELRSDLVFVLRRILTAICFRRTAPTAPAPSSCVGDDHHWSDPFDACVPCTRRFAEELLDTYKCFHLVDANRRPLFRRLEAAVTAKL